MTASRVPADASTPETLWAVVRGGTTPGVYRSTNAGFNFARVSAPGGSHDELSDLAVHPTDPNILWVTRAARTSGRSVIPGAIYSTINGGVNWSQSAPLLGSTTAGNVDQVTGYEAIEAAATAPANGSPVLYTSDVGQFVKKTYRSINGGASWTPILSNPTVGTTLHAAYSGGADMFTLAVDPSNPNLVYAGSQEHLLSGLSDASGNFTWTDRANSHNTDGSHRGRGYSGLVAARVVFGPATSNKVSLNGLDGGNLLQSADGGFSWNRPLATGNIRLNTDNDWMDQWMGAVDTTYADPNTIYLLKGMFGWFAGIAKSTNGGVSFTLTEGSNGLPTGMTFTDRKVTAIEALRTDEVVFTMDGCIWRTINGGGWWAKENKSCALGLGDLVRNPDPVNPLHLFAQGSSAVYESLDGGRTFKALSIRRGISPGATAGAKGRLALGRNSVSGAWVLYASSTDGWRPWCSIIPTTTRPSPKGCSSRPTAASTGELSPAGWACSAVPRSPGIRTAPVGSSWVPTAKASTRPPSPSPERAGTRGGH